jgi:type III secretory pathway lipoprotein EscJ
VVSARVHLAVAATSPLEPDATKPPATASVLLRHHGSAPTLRDADVKRLVAGAVPGLSSDGVTVITTELKTPASTPELVRFGPITTTRGSAPFLKGALAIVAVVNIVLVAAIFALLRRARRAREPASGERPRSSSDGSKKRSGDPYSRASTSPCRKAASTGSWAPVARERASC